MFGVIVAGRLVQTDFQQVDEARFTLPIPAVSSVNHIVFFLTGQMPLPDGFGAAVYYGLPSTNELSWSYLGFVANEKPSAIFKVAKLTSGTGTAMPSFLGTSPSNFAMDAGQLGVAVEPLSEIVQRTPPDSVQPSNLPSLVQFANKMLENFVNYAWSFAKDDSVPAGVVTQWREQFMRKLEQNPYFWRD